MSDILVFLYIYSSLSLSISLSIPLSLTHYFSLSYSYSLSLSPSLTLTLSLSHTISPSGIDVRYFGELMTMSGLVLNEDVKWVSFHSSYDFGYLVKTLTCTELPTDEPAFMDSLHTFFPCIYDVKVRTR